MDELVEVFRRWQAGESPRRIAKALGLVRNTVRSYLRAAEGAGIGRERVLSPEEWAVFVREHFPAIERVAAPAVWWVEFEQRTDEIVQALAQNRVTTVWQRMHGDGKVGRPVAHEGPGQASLIPHLDAVAAAWSQARRRTRPLRRPPLPWHLLRRPQHASP